MKWTLLALITAGAMALAFISAPTASSITSTPTPAPESVVLAEVARALNWGFPQSRSEISDGIATYRVSQTVMAGADHIIEITVYPSDEAAQAAFDTLEADETGRFHGFPAKWGRITRMQAEHYQDARWIAWLDGRRIFRVTTSYNSTYQGAAADPYPIAERLLEVAEGHGMAPAQTGYVVTGTVVDEEGNPVGGATVRVQTTGYFTTTNPDGSFILELPGEGPYNLTAWARGYFCAGTVEVTAGQTDVEIELEAHHDYDDESYEWMPSVYHPGEGEDQGCAACHSAEGTDLDFTLPVDEWLQDAHSQSAQNIRFITMYNGTDVYGNQSPPTRYGYSRDYGTFPLRPDPNEPYYGPGYKLDFPNTDGNCAACHTPAASVNAPYGVNPTELTGVPAEGIPCDFCHKVWDVRLDPESGMPYPNMPGVLSYEFRRPPEGHQYFAGPYDDVAPGEDTYLPVMTQSQFCAPCHFGVFWDTVVYNSFGEWLESPYSDPETGQTCQDCHMPPLGASYFARPDQGGLERDPSTIFSHRMPGAADEELLQNTAEVEVTAGRNGDEIRVMVAVTNTGAGHHIPTDSPLRQIFLIVTATDADGNELPLASGPVLPDWAGDLAGEPGVYFAKILQEIWTEIYPSGAYWMPTRIREDTRIPALQTATSSYTFAAPGSGPVTVEARLIFRRAFYELMRQKSWDIPDILMEEVSVTVE